MAITFTCECGKELRARDELAGRKARCVQCGASFRIPEPEIVIAPACFDDENEGPVAPPRPRVVVAQATLDDDEDDGTPYGVVAPVVRPASRRLVEPTGPTRLAPSTSTYHPSPQATARPTRFPPAAASPASAPATGLVPPKQSAAKSTRRKARGGQVTILEYSYLLLAFALIPLIFSLLGGDAKVELSERFARTIAAAPPDEQKRIEVALAQDSMSLDETLAVLPGNKLFGAHLSRDTAVHWAYAAVATAGFLLLLSLCFSVERAHPAHLLGVGGFTATAGILFLVLVQFCAMIRLGSFRAGGIGLIILLIMWFIGWSYESANDPETGFWLSAFGFTFGVGLCEEFTKAIPMFFWFRRYSEVGWRGACLWGLASGIGFGVSEGIMYSTRYYNGITGAETYLVRFVSCVALHAMWAGSVGIAIARHVDEYEDIHDAAGFGLFALRVMAVPMVLHGFYDTLLKKEMGGWALAVALLSFGWLAWHIELARRARPQGGRPKVPKSVMAYY